MSATTARELPAALGAWPETTATTSALAFVLEHEPPHLVNHSIRSFFYATSIGATQGLLPGENYDGEVLFLSTVLHDIGLTPEGQGPNRFEVDGANRAVALARDLGLDDSATALIWDAIALHTSPGIAGHKQPEVALAHFGIGADIFGFGAELVDPDVIEAAHQAFPWLDLREQLIDTVAHQVREQPSKWAPMSFVDAAVRLRNPAVPFPDLATLSQAPAPMQRH